MHIGIDLGGTKIEALLLDRQGQELFRKRLPTPQGQYDATLHTIRQLVEEAEQYAGQTCSVGIGTPGAISPATGLMKNANSVVLNGKPVHTDLADLLQRTIRIENDANCFALSEATDGAAAGANVVFGVIVGTGTGAGVVVHGKVLTGANAIGGEWGHNPLPWPVADELPGKTCYCGKHGCIETWLSGPGFETEYRQATSLTRKAADIVQLADHGDTVAEQVMQAYEERMAKSLAHIINILDPDVIVLGGGMSNIARLYLNIPQRWGRYVFSDHVSTRLLPPRFGDSSGVRGAAWLGASYLLGKSGC
ncbi:MAG TPA: ROK family protein [Candidatus Thiothrix moscowensis]|uniref:ROK family protein n=1 Tax=unclassified Thiothrix TaxID=2636184 RepID=UPI0025D571AB|nr:MULTISPECIES: ROK family protein [unclassified Thiothrix]HRJ52390.1 ROK family protein [Candidatus Thiothrix moscowensis]HRJ92705.1 ROK family protein [Candidatus Thiothrix moscowensis]